MTNPQRQIRIEYESQGFSPGGPVSNGPGVLDTTWDELLWSAVTVGRPNRQYAFRHGNASTYEALFRWSLTRMALEQRGPTGFRLRRTDAAKTLDPTEKGAVNYFLGMTLSKLFSARLLNAPWVMHLDVFRPQLNPVLRGRSRPDLIGQIHASNQWVAIEAKGRISAPDVNAKTKAKQQAQRVISVNGTAPSFCVGAITYFRNDVLQFFWRDPDPEPQSAGRTIEVSCDEGNWSFYYKPLFELIHSYPDHFRRMLEEPFTMPLNDLDLQVGVHPTILRRIAGSQWEEVRHVCADRASELYQSGYQADGIRVVAGRTWRLPYDEHGE